MMQEAKLVIEKIKAEEYEHLIKHGIDPLVAKILYRRGISSVEEAKTFLEACVLHDPGEIKNIEKVYKIIDEVISKREKVYIFGDYDVDGITATAIMYNTLKELGADVYYRLPDRLTEGYGMTTTAVKELHEKGCSLIITVDNGISCHEEIAFAKELGMKVIIIDHHTPSETLPNADAIVDLHVKGETYPYVDLAGCGVAFKVSCYLYDQFGFGAEEGYKNIDLAAIGTVADVMPLTGENRTIVKEGLKLINSPEYDRIGIISLMNVFEIEIGTLTSMDIGFKLGPALNAPGRLLEEGADQALELLLCDEEDEAINIAMDLKEVNEKRKTVTQECLMYAEKHIEEENLLKDKVLVLFIPHIPEGVVGLVSGKLTEKYHRPSIVFSEGVEFYKASGRSIESFNLYEALRSCHDLFVSYGGHAQAAGMSMIKDEKKLKELRTRINQYADKTIKKEDLQKTIYVDETLKAEDINFSLIEKLSAMEPFGHMNPKPIFYVKGYKTVKKNRDGQWLPYLYMGEHNNHLKLYGESGDVVGFDMVSKYEAAGRPKQLDLVFTLGVNNFMGRQFLQLEMIDFKPAQIEEDTHTDLMKALSNALEEINLVG